MWPMNQRPDRLRFYFKRDQENFVFQQYTRTNFRRYEKLAVVNLAISQIATALRPVFAIVVAVMLKQPSLEILPIQPKPLPRVPLEHTKLVPNHAALNSFQPRPGSGREFGGIYLALRVLTPVDLSTWRVEGDNTQGSSARTLAGAERTCINFDYNQTGEVVPTSELTSPPSTHFRGLHSPVH